MEKSADAKCLFCDSSDYTSSVFEDTLFNRKIFKYLKCKNCSLIYVNPLPTQEDLLLMYPTEYQGEITKANPGQYDSLLGEIKNLGAGKKVLDYGCGNGKFMIEAAAKNFIASGVEFNPLHVERLKKELPYMNFQTVKEFFDSNEKYDVIFLSNVLEHLTNPREIMMNLKSKLNPNGLFVLEGPVENNFSVKGEVMKIFFLLRKPVLQKKLFHAPLHIFYSGKRNQQYFFSTLGIKELYFKIDESPWPFPEKWNECATFQKKLMYLIAKFSISIKRLNRNWGNIFTFIGRV